MSQNPNLPFICPYSLGQNKYQISIIENPNTESTGCISNTATKVVTISNKKIVSTMLIANSSENSCLHCGNQKFTIQNFSLPDNNNSGNEKGDNLKRQNVVPKPMLKN